MLTAIRKNSTKKIESILAGCIMIREFKYDDMGDTMGEVTVARVMECGREYLFDRVVDDADEIRVSIHRDWTFTGYKTVEAARRHLTPQAFAKYFPDAN